jgi:hypothetical protein
MGRCGGYAKQLAYICISSFLANHVQVKGGRNMKYRNITYHHTSTQDLRLLELPKERYQLPGFQADGANIVALNQSSPHEVTIYLITFLKYVNMTIKIIKTFNIIYICRFMMVMMTTRRTMMMMMMQN